jgi:hypothetical protein
LNLALKVALIVSVSGMALFAADYTRLTKGRCWRDPIGLTLLLADIFSVAGLVPLLLAEFFRLSPLGNVIAAWALIGFWFLSGAAMYWRTLVFEREHRRGRPPAVTREDGNRRKP